MREVGIGETLRAIRSQCGGEGTASVVEDEDGRILVGEMFVVQVIQQVFVTRIPGAEGVFGPVRMAREVELALGDY